MATLRASATYPSELPGDGLVLRPWDEGLIAQAANWSERGFPYHAFDLGHLKDPGEAARYLRFAHERGPHRHFVACEEGVAVGRVSVNLRDEAGLYFWGVHVPPEHAGRGVARRMLASIIAWLEEMYPFGPAFVLSSNTFAEVAHRVYRSVGFEVAETRWHFDRQLAERLWEVTPEEREPISRHTRFYRGHWEVRVYIMRRPHGWSPAQ